MKLDILTYELTMLIFRQTEASWEAFEAQCEEERSQGYRPSSCFHGRNMWVDYDCVCGICEDYGYYHFNRQAYRAEALAEAHRILDVVSERTAAVVKMHSLGAPIKMVDFNEWICEPLERVGYVPHYKR